MLGCQPAAEPMPSVTLTLDDTHPTAVIAAGDTLGGTCEMSWNWGEMEGPNTGAADSEGLWSATLLGVPAATEVFARMDCPGGSGSEASIVTGAVPSDVSTLALLGDTAPLSASPYILTTGFAENSALTISTLAGETVWWEAIPVGAVTHPHFDPDAGVVYGIEDDTQGGVALLVAHLTGETERFTVDQAHHDSLALGDGRYLVITSSHRVVEGDEILGDVIVLVDTVSGVIVPVWDAFEELEMIPNDGWDLRTAEGQADWTHMNGLGRDPVTGRIYASLYFPHSIIEIDGETWQTLNVLGGDGSDYSVDDPFGPQHSPILAGDTLWMFDNGSEVSAGSRLAAYTLDHKAKTAELAWEWQPVDAPYTIVLGNIDVHDDVIIASWAVQGQVFMVNHQGGFLAQYEVDGATQVGLTSLISL